MEKFLEIFQDLVVRRLGQLYQFGIDFGPKIALSLIILIIGWICAVLLKKIVSKLLKALGFDVLSEKTGLKSFLEKGGVVKNPSSIVGKCFYWLIIFSALVMVFNTLELTIASQLIKQAIFYIPKIIVAMILLSLGIFLSGFISKFVGTASRLANIPLHAVLSQIARYVLIGVAVMLSLEYLGLSTAMVTQLFIIIFGILPLLLALIFVIGGRDIIASILAGRFLLKEYNIGEVIEFDSVHGKIKSIGFLTTKIDADKGEIVIPNIDLSKRIVRKVR